MCPVHTKSAVVVCGALVFGHSGRIKSQQVRAMVTDPVCPPSPPRGVGAGWILELIKLERACSHWSIRHAVERQLMALHPFACLGLSFYVTLTLRLPAMMPHGLWRITHACKVCQRCSATTVRSQLARLDAVW